MTVSLVLRDDPQNSRITPATRSRVLEAAKELHYQPDARGRALRSGQTNIIGMYTGYGYINVRFPFFTEIISGLQEGCDAFHKDLLLHGVYRDETSTDIYTNLANGKIDGIILNLSAKNPLVSRIVETGFPAIAVADPLPGIPSVMVDDTGGTRILADYLWSRGHRKYVYQTGGDLPESAIRRRDTFLQFMQEHGGHVQVFHIHDHPEGLKEIVHILTTSNSNDRPTAVVCWNDSDAYDMIHQCRIAGLKVPDDVSIAGFDGCPLPYDVGWSLTTIHAPWSNVAFTAVQYLIEQITGKDVPLETTLPVELIEGNTV
jgi:DNA-binding LacI/PurR family transcriptional regulator